jgi:hypothetical protein
MKRWLSAGALVVNVATETFYRAAVWDPQTDTVATQPLTWDMFCNGMAVLPDGRVLVNGGNLQYDRSMASRAMPPSIRQPRPSPTWKTWRTGAGTRP